jgi:prevent-host-death family protein
MQAVDHTRTISHRELRNESSRILREVTEDGASFIITNNGVPVAQIRPLGPPPQRFVSREHVVAAIADGPGFGMTIEELHALHDEVVDPHTIIDPWTGDET